MAKFPDKTIAEILAALTPEQVEVLMRAQRIPWLQIVGEPDQWLRDKSEPFRVPLNFTAADVAIKEGDVKPSPKWPVIRIEDMIA